jgi:hypothetical protein
MCNGHDHDHDHDHHDGLGPVVEGCSVTYEDLAKLEQEFTDVEAEISKLLRIYFPTSMHFA